MALLTKKGGFTKKKPVALFGEHGDMFQFLEVSVSASPNHPEFEHDLVLKQAW